MSGPTTPQSSLERHSPGDQILLREIWQGKLWSARPVVVVEDAPEAIAVYTPAGSIGLFASSASGQPLRIPKEKWTLKERVATDYHVLGIQVPGDAHGTLLLWDEQWRFRCWYINLEDPFWRTAMGFDYKDRILDIVVETDLASWRWKDEDELEEAVAKRIYTKEQALEIRAEGERALERLLARNPPLGRPWERWRPDASWSISPLAPGWESIPQA